MPMLSFRSFTAVVAILALSVVSFATLSATAADESPVAVDQKMATKPRSEPRGRLPNFYGQVVSESQRDEIYAIQSEYQKKLDELIRQVVTIKAERDAKIDETLSADQRKEIAQLRAESEKRREERRASAAKSAEPE